MPRVTVGGELRVKVQSFGRLVLAVVLAFAIVVPPSTVAVAAASGDRTLYLSHTHRDDTVRITYMRNGQYDKEGLKQLNWFLRDWRTNQAIDMDPALYDIIWQDLSGGRRDAAGPHRVVIPRPCHQRHAPLDLLGRRRELAAHAGQGDRHLHPRHRPGEAARHRHALPGRRRRLLPDLRQPLRSHRHRQRAGMGRG